MGSAATVSSWHAIAVRATPRSTPWQLQPAFSVPLLLPAWPQHQLCGTFTAAAVLVDAQQRGTAQHTQQLQHLQQQLLAGAHQPPAAAAAGAARAGVTASGAASSSGALQALSAAAAALVAASGAPDSPHQESSAACATPAEVIHCSSALYGALCSTLQQQKALHGSSSSTAQPEQPAGLQPAALICAATSTGQVWLCDPVRALQQLPASSSTHQQQQLLLQQLQSLKQPATKLLLDLQQHSVAVLPISLGRDGTAGLFLAGSLGRLVLLRTRQKQQGGQAAAVLTAQQQLQLPFQVAAAAVIAAAESSSEHSIQQQRDPQQPANSQAQALLLLLSSAGRLYAASLDAVASSSQAIGATEGEGQQPAAPTTAAAGVPAGSPAELLPVHPVHIPLPAPVSRLWTVEQPLVATAAARAGGTAGPLGAAAAVGAAAAAAHSSVVVQLAGSTQLLEVAVRDILTAVAAASTTAAQLGTPAGAASAAAGAVGCGAAGDTTAAAVAEARQQLEDLMSALETLAAARQHLEQAAVQQDAYLRGMQQDMALLGLLQQQQQGHVMPGAAGGHPLQQHQRPQVAYGGVTAGGGALSSSRGSTGSTLRCNIQLHGLWPILGAAADALSPSSSIHMAVSVQLQQQQASSAGVNGSTYGSSSSSSGGGGSTFSRQLGPGWQLVVSFVPEFADSRSVQTTVDISTTGGSSSHWGASSSGSNGPGGTLLQASVMLPLPVGCGALQQGGWVMVYAVKQPTGPSAAAGAGAGDMQQGRQQLLPVVTLLCHRYVSVLQLSLMAAANSAVRPVVAAAGGLRGQVALQNSAHSHEDSSSHGSISSRAPATYSCVMQLSAAAREGRTAGAAAAATAVQGGGGAKRPRSASAQQETAAADGAGAGGTAQQAPQGERTAAAQGAAEQVHSAGDRDADEQQLLVLQEWLQRALCLNPGPTATPPLPSVQPLSWGAAGQFLGAGSSGYGSSRGVTAAAGDRSDEVGSAVARQGQVLFTLGAGEVGRAAWGLSTGQEPPSIQLLSAAAAGAGGVLAGTKRAAAGAAGGEDSSGAVALSLQLQAGQVPALASMHRAVLLDVLQQLGAERRSCSPSNSSKGRADGWQLAASVDSLKLALSRLRQLHQHMLKLQETAEQAQEMLHSLRPLAAVASQSTDVDSSNDADLQEAVSEQLGRHRELWLLLGGLERGLHAAYGRFLLAVSDAATVSASVT